MKVLTSSKCNFHRGPYDCFPHNEEPDRPIFSLKCYNREASHWQKQVYKVLEVQPKYERSVM